MKIGFIVDIFCLQFCSTISFDSWQLHDKTPAACLSRRRQKPSRRILEHSDQRTGPTRIGIGLCIEKSLPLRSTQSAESCPASVQGPVRSQQRLHQCQLHSGIIISRFYINCIHYSNFSDR